MTAAAGRAQSKTARPILSSPQVVQVAVMEGDPLRFVGLCSLLEEEATIALRLVSLSELANLPLTANYETEIAISSASHRVAPLDLLLVGDAYKASLLSAIAQVRASRRFLPILASGAGLRDEDIIQVLASGAKGYVDHSCSAEEFARAIHAVHGGGVWASRRVLSQLVDRVADMPCANLSGQSAFTPAELHLLEGAIHSGDPASRPALTAIVGRLSAAPCGVFGGSGGEFTDREGQVLHLLVAGHSNREIGAELRIEERTVKAHVAKLMRKVGVENRVALSVHAIRHALIDN